MPVELGLRSGDRSSESIDPACRSAGHARRARLSSRSAFDRGRPPLPAIRAGGCPIAGRPGPPPVASPASDADRGESPSYAAGRAVSTQHADPSTDRAPQAEACHRALRWPTGALAERRDRRATSTATVLEQPRRHAGGRAIALGDLAPLAESDPRAAAGVRRHDYRCAETDRTASRRARSGLGSQLARPRAARADVDRHDVRRRACGRRCTRHDGRSASPDGQRRRFPSAGRRPWSSSRALTLWSGRRRWAAAAGPARRAAPASIGGGRAGHAGRRPTASSGRR